MRKPNPFIVSLNQPPKGVHLGPNRRPSPTAHRNPSDGTDQGTRGTVNLAPGAINYALPIGTFPKGSGAGLTAVQAIQSAIDKMIQQSFYGLPSEPKPPTLPYAGIRTGEIIGHRAWWVLPDGLYSLAHLFRWEPGATVEGDLNQLVFRDMYHFNRDIWGGVYAYANASLVNIECSQLKQAIDAPTPRAVNRSHPINFAIGLVRGTVKLWGEVIEHEVGWRAQYAKLASIEETWGDQLRLREILEPYHASLAL